MFISRLAHFTGMRKELFLGNQIKSIKVPTLIIWGKKDPLMPYKSVKYTMEALPQAQIRILENIGHMPPVEAPDKFNEIVTKFLKE